MKHFLGLLLLIGLIAAYFWQIVAVAAVVGLVWLGVRWLQRMEERAALRAAREREVIARADQQHNWALQGDPRGTFGENYAPL